MEITTWRLWIVAHLNLRLGFRTVRTVFKQNLNRPNRIKTLPTELKLSRVAESVVTLLRRNEPSKDLVSQSLSSKLTCERERWLTRLLNSCSQLRARSRERSAHKALDLLLTAHSAFERERSAHKALELLLTAQSAFEREISLQDSWPLAHSSQRVQEKKRERSAHKAQILIKQC